ncbi:MAG: hypothetical protein ACOC2W_01965 [bacterium]
MNEFANTIIGRKFFNLTLPNIEKNLDKLVKQQELTSKIEILKLAKEGEIVLSQSNYIKLCDDIKDIMDLND